jgi:alkanesulfonate monooxygenase SsuD/methylene tetrahydromethanopterin reductase-like flavin-dependent oxidoreductase (luciferase family)
VLQVPKHDPLPLAAMIAAATTRLGVVATMSTMAYPPFMLARLASTIDHISGGRFGWNIVTSGEDAAVWGAFDLAIGPTSRRKHPTDTRECIVPAHRRRPHHQARRPGPQPCMTRPPSTLRA